MPLNMPAGYSRYKKHLTRSLPGGAVEAFREMVNIIAGQGDAKEMYEHFKRYFAPAGGQQYMGSSDETWASTDLNGDMRAAAANTPLFLSAFYDAIEALRAEGQYDLPTIDDINELCRSSRLGFEIHPPDIVERHVVVARALNNIATAVSNAAKELQAQEQTRNEEEAHREFPEFFDVAITVAGPERKLARKLAELLEAAGLTVFYDEFFKEHLWGQNLSDMFDDIFRVRSRFCAMFVSRAYAEREWTNHERQSALARAMKEKGKAYVLPIRVDNTNLPGLPPTVGHMSLNEHSIDEIAKLLIKKVRAAKKSPPDAG